MVTLKLKDNKVVNILDDTDFSEYVRKYMGDDAGDYFDDILSDLKYFTEKEEEDHWDEC